MHGANNGDGLCGNTMPMSLVMAQWLGAMTVGALIMQCYHAHSRQVAPVAAAATSVDTIGNPTFAKGKYMTTA